ncbi:MAG: excinuclease ABC subunit C [Chitinophagales bacterium]|nr:excinuclease ABC subunit C [Chitinophagales bacterium]
MDQKEFNDIRKSIPKLPGVYKFLGDEDQLLYVGKAKNLKNRVSSYFIKKKYESARIKLLSRRTHRIEFTVVDTEQDALLLENSLIKENQPKYNVQLKDDKSYAYICIKKERFPRIFFTRKLIKDGSEYLGPYTSLHKARTIMGVIKSIFPLRTCTLKLSEKNIEAGKFKVCLEYHIGNCLGPCVNYQSEEDYQSNVDQVRNILKGKLQLVQRHLKDKMQIASESFEFEKANAIKEKISYLESYQSKSTIVNPRLEDLAVYAFAREKDIVTVYYLYVSNGTIIQSKSIELKVKMDESDEDLLNYVITDTEINNKNEAKEILLPFEIDYPDSSKTILVPSRGDKKHLLDLAMKNATFNLKEKLHQQSLQKGESRENRVLKTLQEDLRMKVMPMHIECFDNSNIQGSFPVASVVVFKNGKSSKKEYRHFNIKTVEGPNDFASMEEIVYRRYFRFIEEKIELPQLIVIDGGKGQLSSAVKSLKKLHIYSKLTIIGIAKKLEEIYFPEDPIPLHINKKSESLKLIQRVRDEAHRFAIEFHRNKRKKTLSTSELEMIEGVGPKTIEKLISEMKSVKKIKQASLKELAYIIGDTKAKLVYAYFRDQ